MSEIFDEALVQWVLLKHPEHLSQLLGLAVGRCIGTEVTTKHGRVDFIFEVGKNKMLIVELELNINSTSKFDHCTEQLSRYIKLQSEFSQKLQVALLYASEHTSDKFRDKLGTFTEQNGIILRTYSLRKILLLYNSLVNRLYRTSGLSLGRAVALGVTSITWLKKFMAMFLAISENDLVDEMPWKTLKRMFSSSTNFYVLKRLAEDFEMISVRTLKKSKRVILTGAGRTFGNDLLLECSLHKIGLSCISSRDLTLSQKRLLLEILLNGNFTKIKVNIFHFLRFVHLTEGGWLPKQSTKLTAAEQQFLNNMFKASYNARTLNDLVLQTCTFCEELGLVEKLPVKDQLYDNVMFTTLGSRVYNYFEQLLHVERERYQIPLQVE